MTHGAMALQPNGFRMEGLTFDFCLSTSIPVLTTSTYVVAWPQGDRLLGWLVVCGHWLRFANTGMGFGQI